MTESASQAAVKSEPILGIVCPDCGCGSVKFVRLRRALLGAHRERSCTSCGCHFSTFETYTGDAEKRVIRNLIREISASDPLQTR